MAKVSILGAGSWGIALAYLLHTNGHEVTVWSALEKEIDMLQSHHEHAMLKGVLLPEDMVFTTDDEEAVKDKDLLVFSVASTYTRTTAHKLSPYIAKDQLILNVAKGIEESTLMTLSDIIEQEIPQAKVAVMSGPSHAEEVGRGLPTSIVVGAHAKKDAEYIQTVFMNERFRVYISPDILGMEIGGSLKNVVALAAGIADGLGYGDNAKAALITRGIAEISRLGIKMGARYETLNGLSGIGDLIVTCASMHSRNRRCGIMIGEGMDPKEATAKVGMVVEGMFTTESAYDLAVREGVDMPITTALYNVINGKISAREALELLMGREKRHEED